MILTTENGDCIYGDGEKHEGDRLTYTHILEDEGDRKGPLPTQPFPRPYHERKTRPYVRMLYYVS